MERHQATLCYPFMCLNVGGIPAFVNPPIIYISSEQARVRFAYTTAVADRILQQCETGGHGNDTIYGVYPPQVLCSRRLSIIAAAVGGSSMPPSTIVPQTPYHMAVTWEDSGVTAGCTKICKKNARQQPTPRVGGLTRSVLIAKRCTFVATTTTRVTFSANGVRFPLSHVVRLGDGDEWCTIAFTS